MGISNTIPPSRLIQPGVVANTAARPTSPFTGQAIYQVDTNQMLIWNGTAWVIPNTPAQNPTGLELVTTTTCTSGGTVSNGVVTANSAVSSITIDACFNSTYKAYKIMVAGGTASTGNVLNLQLVQSTGSVLTSGYYETFIYSAYSGASALVANGNNLSYFQRLGGVIDTSGVYGTCELINPFIATNTIYTSSPRADAAGGNAGNSTGQQSSLVSCTGFKLLASTGTISGTTITIYGYRQ